MAIQVKTLDQLKTMRRAGLVVAEIHKAIREAIKPGMTTSALDTIADRPVRKKPRADAAKLKITRSTPTHKQRCPSKKQKVEEVGIGT